MKRLFLLILAFVFATCQAIAQSQSAKVLVFELFSPDLPDSSAVFVSGSIAQLGNWNPASIKMEAKGNHLWRLTIQGEFPDLIEYKFTLGSWEKEAAGANGLPLQNFVLKAKENTSVKHDIYFWLDGKPHMLKGEITGKVNYHPQMKGDGILDRDIVVLLPSDYKLNPKKKYPVLYMHDGQNLFDPATSSFGVDWQIDETLDSLAKLGTVQIPIVVGIYNTSERTADYTPGEQNKKYMKFVAEIVKPFIDANYRTLSSRKNTAIGGSSYGGLVSFMLAWEYPQVFSKAFCLSPAFKVQNIDYVQTVLNDAKPKKLVFYIDNGGLGLEEQLQPGIDDMLEALKKNGLVENKDFFWILDSEARHFESDWAKRMPHAFELLYKFK